MTKKRVWGVVGAACILAMATQPGFGFVTPNGAESAGANAFAFFVYIIGGWLIYRAFGKATPSA